MPELDAIIELPLWSGLRAVGAALRRMAPRRSTFRAGFCPHCGGLLLFHAIHTRDTYELRCDTCKCRWGPGQRLLKWGRRCAFLVRT